MLSSVLHSKRAIQVNIIIMRIFVKLRKLLSVHKELTVEIKALEGKLKKHDHQIIAIFDAIRQLMELEERPKEKIGFHT